MSKVLATAEIMREAFQVGEINQKEYDVSIKAWDDTKEDANKRREDGSAEMNSNDRVAKFRKTLGTNFGPKRSEEIYNIVSEWDLLCLLCNH